MSRPPRTAGDPWQQLRSCTRARIALGRTGSSLPTTEVLRFGVAHAAARDAVHAALDVAALATALAGGGFRVLQAHSAATDRQVYLLRPDLGRRLDDESRMRLEKEAPASELAIVVGDGLSAAAVQEHALPVLERLRGALDGDWDGRPVVIARQARVALGDGIACALRARAVAVLIGERPGLSSTDSLGIYFTWSPRIGSLDSERNCISNIRPAGLGYDDAARQLAALIRLSRRLGMSGVRLGAALLKA
ncbi:ethanolamine ammonia-lyase subunit EutC [Noviherbaspirillum aridicola]|uniref:Ethanolamine ammonia-lyase small subunit n=1 Tax=Noviherbaspirillum aridicola TaxID=2849687 RepID=A0ABQ4PZU4_9BURK|nr:ethanolamine ammonia-lyase subunit EutC [Noviherbaspirillum aridicola]GIZ50338.1 ethanolamine ammonia-lyase light chain [Noviherbaspirillum aridicola]